LFNRDLKQLIAEIEHYKIEAGIWRVKAQTNNSVGNLCLYLVGNLNTYIGRESELSSKDITR
jgi:hypothetical protein